MQWVIQQYSFDTWLLTQVMCQTQAAFVVDQVYYRDVELLLPEPVDPGPVAQQRLAVRSNGEAAFYWHEPGLDAFGPRVGWHLEPWGVFEYSDYCYL